MRVDDEEIEFPTGSDDERELLLQWLGYLRGAVMRNAAGLDDQQAHWQPDDKLISLIGIVTHLTNVEWRWIDGAFFGVEVSRSESEFSPAPGSSIRAALDAYRDRATATDEAVRGMSLEQVSDPARSAEGMNLRWVLLHLINETARHAGHADATRELLDGWTGE